MNSRRLNRKSGKKKYHFSSSYDDTYFQRYDEDEEQFQIDDIIQSQSFIKPRNELQHEYEQILNNTNHKLVFATGPAGTGKTLLACAAAVNGLIDGNYDKIIVTRPVVNVDENLGYLPGDIAGKMDPYLKPMFDVFSEFYSQSNLQHMLNEKIIEICPIAFMRGRTFKHSFIIADEMQNSTVAQMKMILTRIGDGSKMVVTGDLHQHDRKYEINGLKDILKKLENKNYKRIKAVEFQSNQIERSQIVKDILEVYEKKDTTADRSCSSLNQSSSSSPSSTSSSMLNSESRSM